MSSIESLTHKASRLRRLPMTTCKVYFEYERGRFHIWPFWTTYALLKKPFQPPLMEQLYSSITHEKGLQVISSFLRERSTDYQDYNQICPELAWVCTDSTYFYCRVYEFCFFKWVVDVTAPHWFGAQVQWRHFCVMVRPNGWVWGFSI